MKLRLLGIFIGAFLVTFGLLNSRFLYAYLVFKLHNSAIEHFVFSSRQTEPLPISDYRSDTTLPDTATLYIDRIGISAPIVFNAGDNANVLYKDLEKGVVHYSPTVKPGQVGTAIILGHSSAYPWYRGQYGSVFALLGQLKIGDRMYVRYSDGRIFRFTVDDSLVFNPLSGLSSDIAQMDSFAGEHGRASIILMSCWPVGTAYRRIAVRAIQS